MARSRAVSVDVEKLIKRANQRLRQLEKDGLANQSKAYQFIMNKAQKNMASQTKTKMFTLTSSGQIKFRTDLATLKKANANVYNAVVKLATGFTEAKSSTKIGVTDAYKDSYEGFKNTTGFTGSFNDFSDLWENTNFKELVKRFGVSNTVSMADDISDKFGISFDDALKGMYESGASSQYGMYEYFEVKYRLDESDEETV